MNISGNNRYLETEQRIMNAFIELLNKKDINSISVSDICKKGQLSRPTFYSHYEDINDLVYKIEEDKSKKINELLVLSTCSLHDKFVQYFDFLRENNRFYKAYFTMESNTSLVKKMMQSYKDNLTASSNYSVAVHYYMLFFKAGIKEIAAEWLNRGCIESSAYMADLLTKELSCFIS